MLLTNYLNLIEVPPPLNLHPTQPLLNWRLGPIPSVPFDAPALVPEGFGASATGGQGGTSLIVTTLSDVVDTPNNTAAGVLSNPGPDGFISLREALVGARTAASTMGPRIITISSSLSGNITLNSEIEVENGAPGNYDDITIDFSGAANQGVQILENVISWRCDNVIARYLKIRNGSTTGTVIDAMRVDSGSLVMIDHCSLGAGDDGDMDVVGNSTNVTVQHCFIGPGFGAGNVLIKGAGVDNVTYHHNVILKSDGGTPRWPEAASGDIQWVNNIHYTDDTPIPRMEAASSWPPDTAVVQANIIGNYFQQGPDLTAYSPTNPVIYFFNDRAFSAGSSFFLSTNVVANPSGITHTTQTDIYGNDIVTINGSPFAFPTITTTSAAQAYIDTLANSGARLPCVDAWDQHIITGITNSTIGEGIVDQAAFGGFPTLTSPCTVGTSMNVSKGKVIHKGKVLHKK